MATKAEILQALASLAAAFRLERLAPETVEVYASCLEDLPGPVLDACVRRLACAAKFFPAISEIRAEAVAIQTAGRPSAHEAWGAVIDEVHRIGSYGAPSLPPEIMRCVHAIGGWRRICMAESDEQMANRAQFLRCYDALADRDDRTEQLLPGDREVSVSELLEMAQRRVQIGGVDA